MKLVRSSRWGAREQRPGTLSRNGAKVRFPAPLEEETMAEKETDQVPSDPQLLAAQLQKAQAEARKLNAEARRAEVDSLLPAIPTELPAETLSVPDKGSPIGALAAYRSINQVATRIAEAVPGDVDEVWLVPDERASRYRAIEQIVTSRLERFEAALTEARKLIEEPSQPGDDKADRRIDIRTIRTIAPLGVVATAGLSLAASALPALMSFFKTDTTVRGRDVALSFLPVAARVAAELRSAQGAQRRVVIGGASTPATGELANKLSSLEEQRDDSARQLASYRVKHTDEAGPGLAGATDRLAALKSQLDAEAKKDAPMGLDSLVTKIEEASRKVASQRRRRASHVGAANVVAEVIDAIDAFLAQVLTADASGLTPLATAEASAALRNSHILVLDPSFAGGESVYEQVQTKRDRGLHMGALVVSYVLAAPDGVVVASGVETAHQAALTEMGSPDISWE
jgi:hypothetical protein